MRWGIKFPTKGKREAGGAPDAGKSLQGPDSTSFRNGGGSTVSGTGPQQGNFRSGSEGGGEVDQREIEEENIGAGGLESNARTPIVTPPDAANGGDQTMDNREDLAEDEPEEEDQRDYDEEQDDEYGRNASSSPIGGDRGRRKANGEDWEEIGDGAAGTVGGGLDNQDQEGVLDDESQGDADSLHASKTGHMKSFVDDQDARDLEDSDGDWEGAKAGSAAEDNGGEEREVESPTGSPRVSRGDDRLSGNGGGGSHSYHSENEALEEGYDASNASPDNPSRGRTSTEGGKSGTYNSFGGMSGNPADGGSVDGTGGLQPQQQQRQHAEQRYQQQQQQRQYFEQRYQHQHQQEHGRSIEDDREPGHHGERVDDHDRGHEEDDEHEHILHDGIDEEHVRHHDHAEDVGNGGRGGAGIDTGYGYGSRTGREYMDVERRANAHAYTDELDGSGNTSREMAGPYGSGGGGYNDRHGSSQQQQQQQLLQQRRLGGNSAALMPPVPPGVGAGGAGGVVNGISPVDARAAAALAARTRLTAGGVGAPDRVAGVGQRPEPGPVMAAGQAAAAAAAALRRGPTPGSHSLPSMVLVPLEALKSHRRVPRSSDRRALVRYRDLTDRSRSFVVFVSHAWMRPHTTPSFAHPDTSSRGGEKYRLIAEAGDRIRAHLPPDVRVLLWIDYSCVDQDSTRRSKATMRGMREYMRRCDAILTVYPGEAADNGEEFLPNRFVKSCAWAGSYKSLAHYCTRGWCRLEMLLGQMEPLPQDGFMFNFLVPKKKKPSGAKASVGDRPHFLYGAHQRPHNGRIDVVPRQSSRWFEEHHPEQGNFTHESDRDAIRAVLAKQMSTMAKRTAAIAARHGTDPRRGVSSGGGGGGGISGSMARQGDHRGPHPH